MEIRREKVILNSGNRRLIGEVSIQHGVDSTGRPDTLRPKPGSTTVVYKAYELKCDMFLIPTPQGPMGLQKSTVVPVDTEEDAVDVHVHIDNIRYFSDMPDKGRKYELMVSEFEEMMMQNRANRAGLTVAKSVPSSLIKK